MKEFRGGAERPTFCDPKRSKKGTRNERNGRRNARKKGRKDEGRSIAGVGEDSSDDDEKEWRKGAYNSQDVRG